MFTMNNRVSETWKLNLASKLNSPTGKIDVFLTSPLSSLDILSAGIISLEIILNNTLFEPYADFKYAWLITDQQRVRK